jgi:hypothetical protein
MSFKKFRHSVGRLLGIRRYLFMAEPGKTLDLDAMLGAPRGPAATAGDRVALRRLFAACGFRPRGVVHCGACSAEDLAWYADAGFGRVLVSSASAGSVASAPAGLKVAVADFGGGILRLRPDGGKQWEALLASHVAEPDEFTFFRFAEPGWVPAGLPAFVEAVSWRCQAAGREPRLSAAPAEGHVFVEQGLNLAWLGLREADGTAIAAYFRRPVVTMSDFGRNGRFGNQLFQRVYLRLVTERQGAVLQLPLWAGTALFGSQDPPLSARSLPRVREEALDVAARRLLFAESIAGFEGLDFSGYGMLPTGLFAAYKDQIRSDHAFDPRLAERFDRAVRTHLEGGKKLVVIHLRRGDYGYGKFFRAPCAWYQTWSAEQGFTPAGHVIFICSEDPGRYRDRFPGFTVITADDLGTPPELAPYFDFLAMSRADALAIANSSFSFFAAMLNAQAGCFVRPDALRGGLVPFDPWDAEPLLDQKLSPEEHRRLKEID